MKLSDDIDEFNAAMQKKYGRYYILAALTPDERNHALQLAERVRGEKSHISDGSDEIEIFQCQMCGCTLDGAGLDQQQKYVCEDCRARNPAHLPALPTAQIA